MNYRGSLKELSRRLLREADDEEEVETGNDSLDEQIDKYFSSYEKEAKKSKNEGLDFRSMTRSFLFEAGEDEEEEEVEKLKEEDVDIASFTNDVIRLVENYDSLLEVQNTILRRASNFLSKNYDKEVVDKFKEELSTNHGIEIGKTESEMMDEFQPPRAGFAGPAGGGA